ncbi:hypothetical protein C8Q73DRAFT_126345 [Cubamyces lactineus]|nr:hypothetical protein C8Q73DRAFT_126345 [Cubamyces lactineus]
MYGGLMWVLPQLLNHMPILLSFSCDIMTLGAQIRPNISDARCRNRRVGSPRPETIFTPRNHQVPMENANTALRHAVTRGRHEAWPGTASLIRRRNDVTLRRPRRPSSFPQID